MTVIAAAYEVLKGSGTPLTVDVLTQRILEKKLWSTSGKTPSATVGARIYADIKKRGDKSLFTQTAKNTFAVRGTATPYVKPMPQKKEATKKNDARAKKEKAEEFSFTECAVKVLEQFSDKKPMHYSDITDKALQEGWLVSEGKTPHATMYAQILTDVRRCQERKEVSRFVQYGKGLVGLTKWRATGLAYQIEQHNELVRKKLKKQLLDMPPDKFEDLIARLLVELGFEAEVTKYNGDKGIDIRGTLVTGGIICTKLAIQAKKWKDNIHSPVVQQVRGSLGAHEQGLIITTSAFSSGAIAEASQADKTPIALMNGDQLVKLLMEHDIGVHHTPSTLYDLNEP